MSEKKRLNLGNLTLSEMREAFSDSSYGINEKSFRANQVYRWISQGATSFSEMNNLSKALREKLSANCVIEIPKTVTVQQSKTDGTRKYLFEMKDGNRIESVFMKYHYGNSICLSSQAGCKMGCAFCASTRNGLERNLTAGEMVAQLLAAERDTKERIGHIVIMGTGEPFENYEELTRFLTMVHEKEGLGIGWRNITVSTCGIVPVMKQFMEDFPQVNLAISLHAPNDALRKNLMPIDRTYPLDQLMDAAKAYVTNTGRRITFEYALMKDVNDDAENIHQLAMLLKGMNCHVNLIPLNEVSETEFRGSGRARATEIAEFLEKRGIPATVRRELGSDIDAACGQLRLSRDGE